MTGVLVPPRVFAEQVDAQRKWLVYKAERPEGKTEEGKQLDRDLDEVVDEDGNVDVDTVPGDLTGRVIARGARPFHHAQRRAGVVAVESWDLSVSGSARDCSQIAAWWVIQVDDSGSASFPLFVTSPE